MTNYHEAELMTVDMLVTPEFFPIPDEAEVLELIGDEYVITSEDGAKEETRVTGRHMVLRFVAAEFAKWVGQRVFWLFNEETGGYNLVQITWPEGFEGF